MATTARRAWILRMAARLWWAPVVAVGLMVDRGLRTRWLLTPGIVVLAASVSTVGKLVIRRARPGAPTRFAPPGRLGAAGFPSTHTACAFAIAGWQRGSRQGWWLHLVAVAIGYLRVHRRAHYVGDVLAGAILGYGIAWRIDGVWSRPFNPRATRPEGCAGNHRVIRTLEPRSVYASVSGCRSPLSPRGPFSAPAAPRDADPTFNEAQERGSAREQLGAMDSALEVG